MFRHNIRQAGLFARRAFSSYSRSTSYNSKAHLRPVIGLAAPVVGYLGYQAFINNPIKNESIAGEISENEVQTPDAHLLSTSDVENSRRKEAEDEVVQQANDNNNNIDQANSETPQQEGEEAPQSAFNPETGEINWDCPCLGGMAHGPCGEEFKTAFSCFVYSTAEPKGMECVEKFQAMQNCFREHPEVYSEEIRDEPAPTDGLEQQPSEQPTNQDN